MTTSPRYYENFTGSRFNKECIIFKILLFTYKALHHLAPLYMQDWPTNNFLLSDTQP